VKFFRAVLVVAGVALVPSVGLAEAGRPLSLDEAQREARVHAPEAE
jgi:hypothetical protein